MNNINNIINIQRNDWYKISKLSEIKETINKLFWEISNFKLRLESNYGLNLSNSQNDIILEYKNNIIFLSKKGYNLIIDFFDFVFDFDPPKDEFYNHLSKSISIIVFDNSIIYLDRYQSFHKSSFLSNKQSQNEPQHESHHESHIKSHHESHIKSLHESSHIECHHGSHHIESHHESQQKSLHESYQRHHYYSFYGSHCESPNESYFKKLSQKSNPENEFGIICFKCKINNPIYLCQTCNMLVCKNCLKTLHKNSKNKHQVINFLENKDKEITLFLNSISAIFKNLLIKCDFLLKNNIEFKKTKDIYTSKIDYIKKYKNYPYLDKIICFEDVIDFLVKLEKETNGSKINNEIFQNSFHFSKLEKKLVDLVNNIFFEGQDPNISKENNINFQIDSEDDEEDFFIKNE